MDPQSVYRFCPKCRAELKISDNKKMECPVCGFVAYFSTIPSSIVMLINPQNQILLVKRKLDPQAGFWDLPGGFVELNETVEQAAIRECKEETGLDISEKDLVFFRSAYDRYLFKGINWYVLGLNFLVKIGNDQMPVSGDDAAELKFFPLYDLPVENMAYERVIKLVGQLNVELQKAT